MSHDKDQAPRNHNDTSHAGTPPDMRPPHIEQRDFDKISLQQAIDLGLVNPLPDTIPHSVTNNPDDAAFRELSSQPAAVQQIETNEDKKSSSRLKKAIAIGAGAVTLLVGAGIGVKAMGDNTPNTASVSSPENPGTVEKDKYTFPDSVALTQKFDTLNPSQQETIKTLHSLSVDEFRARPIEEQMMYGAWIVENNYDRTMAQVQKEHEQIDTPLIGERGTPSIYNTAQEIDNQRAVENVVASYLIDWESLNGQGYNVDTARKMTSVMYSEESGNFANDTERIDKIESGEMPTAISATPGIVMSESPLMESNGVYTKSYTTDMEYQSNSSYDSSRMTMKWIAFTDIHGNNTGKWQVKSGLDYIR